jgi:predicted phosphoribosyltransferase
VIPDIDRRQAYDDRRHAGRVLAQRLQHFRGGQAIVLALPRGGVPVAHEVARALELALDVFLVRKLGVPGHRELAMGAIASGGIRVLNYDVIAMLRVPASIVDAVAREEQIELERRERAYRDGRTLLDLRDRIVLLIDDGLATGSSMKAAAEAVRTHHRARVVVAVPVGSPDTCRAFAELADEIVCARAPEPFAAVGQWYRDFSQTSDEEVRQLLRAHVEPATRTP